MSTLTFFCFLNAFPACSLQARKKSASVSKPLSKNLFLEEKYISAMKNRINGYKLNDCVKFLGNCKKVPELMQSLDVFLMPSLWEGLPVVLVEAQAAGLPCYCYKRRRQHE